MTSNYQAMHLAMGDIPASLSGPASVITQSRCHKYIYAKTIKNQKLKIKNVVCVKSISFTILLKLFTLINSFKFERIIFLDYQILVNIINKYNT